MNEYLVRAAEACYNTGCWWGHPLVLDDRYFDLVDVVMEPAWWVDGEEEVNTWLILVAAAIFGDDDFNPEDFPDSMTKR